MLQSSIPVQRGCLVKIEYPSDFTIDDSLGSVAGTGFFAPLGGTVPFTADPSANTVVVEGCAKNYGSTTFGVLTLSQVLNQPYVKASGTFKLRMTEEGDDSFDHVYQ